MNNSYFAASLLFLMQFLMSNVYAANDKYSIYILQQNKLSVMDSSGTIRDLYKIKSRCFARDDTYLYIQEDNQITVLDYNCTKIRTITPPKEVSEFLYFTLLPGNRIAYLDNRNDNIYITTIQGEYLKTINLEKTTGELQDLKGIATKTHLIIYDGGCRKIFRIDLASYEITTVTDLTLTHRSFIGFGYHNGKYYLKDDFKCFYAFEEGVYSFEAWDKISFLPEGYIGDMKGVDDVLFFTTYRPGRLYTYNLTTDKLSILADNLDTPTSIEVVNYSSETARLGKKPVQTPTTYSISGTIQFNGEPISRYTDAKPSILCRNNLINQDYTNSVKIDYDNTTAKFRIDNIPSKFITVYCPFMINPEDAMLPGNFEGTLDLNMDLVSPEEKDKFKIECFQYIHLTSPFNNGTRTEIVPVHSSPVDFQWKPVPGAKRYQFEIYKWKRGESRLDTVINRTVEHESFHVILPPINIDEFYNLSMQAFNAQNKEIGRLMRVYSAGYGSHRFRIEEATDTATHGENGNKNGIEVYLKPYNQTNSEGPRWTPMGKRHPLEEVQGGLETKFFLGTKDLPAIRVRLEKSAGSASYDKLCIDNNRNNAFDQEEWIETKPILNNGRMHSNFTAEVKVPTTDPITNQPDQNIYHMSVWYIEDPQDASQGKILRFTRQWWLEGKVEINGIRALILLSEMNMDGVFDIDDEWVIVPADQPTDLYESKNTQSISQYAWLKEKAYRIKELHPSGRKIVLEQIDPGLTRKEDERRRDPYADDREAPRASQPMAFLHDYKEACSISQKTNKPLLVDFETSWCGLCKVMNELVYTSDEVVKTTAGWVCVKIDGDQDKALVKELKITGYPTMVVFSPEGKEIDRQVGYLGVKSMAKWLRSTTPQGSNP